ncbi:thioesterase [Psychrobacter frigidicola]|uniref:Thioesterase n=1 Tax=Psychrobacter frigidicola TaxID=45611 RepID=A0A5C7A144_9GAMM|nr:thioesterase family protein [Psychrobacter frigidicola]TXD96156.1 thioesterase [Psychrobacter frigidicola]
MSDQELIFDDEVFVFETVMRVRSTEIDGGQYLTLESLTTLLAEARARFLYSKGIQEINADHQGIMVNNLHLKVMSRVRAREELLFEVGVEQLSENGGEMAIKVTRMHDGSLVALARQHFVSYDYRLDKITTLTSMIQEVLSPPPFDILMT